MDDNENSPKSQRPKNLSKWLFITPNLSSVHERMELEWVVKNGHQPNAICLEKNANSAKKYFSRVFHIEEFTPSRFRLYYGVGLFLLNNMRTLMTIPLKQWKRAVAYIRDEVRAGLAILACAEHYGILNLYSFWAFNPVRNQVVNLLNKTTYHITRAHRGDIYHHSTYIGRHHIWPWRNKALKTFDQILSVSNEGTSYFHSEHGLTNVYTVYLGSRKPPTIRPKHKSTSQIVFVSVANIIPLKRLEKIAEILHELPFSVEWHHFGEARNTDFEAEIKLKIHTLLAETKHEVIWEGQQSIDDIFQFYINEKPHLFLSCSESEGIPVSIMEAMSCGIPILTTNAGGSHELIHDNGLCIPVDFNPKEAANWIEKNIFDSSSLTSLRTASVEHWKNRFSFDVNQAEWLKRLLKEN